MKIKMGLAVLLILSGLTVSGCAEKNSSVESVKREPGSELRIGIIDGSDRFAMKSNQEYTGTEPEILKKLSEFGEYRLSFKEAEGIQELIELLEKGEIDIAAGRISEGYEIGEGYISSRNYGKGGYYLVNPKNDYSDNLGIMYEQNVGLSRYI